LGDPVHSKRVCSNAAEQRIGALEFRSRGDALKCHSPTSLKLDERDQDLPLC
jgi:hypothetical protein